jgi:hypothetical protein
LHLVGLAFIYLITVEACQATNSCCKKYNDDSLKELKDMF